MEFNFAECLERKTLKKLANADVFNTILEEFRKRLSKEFFIEINKRHFHINKYDFLAIDVTKLQVKYNALKKE